MKENWKTIVVVIGVIVLFIGLFTVSRMNFNDDAAPVDSSVSQNGEEETLDVEKPQTSEGAEDTETPREDYDTVKDQEQWNKVSQGFSDNIITSKGSQGWKERVKPYTTSKLQESLNNVSDDTVPTGTKIGDPEVSSYGKNYVILDTKYSTSTGDINVRFRVIKVGSEWKVDLYQPTKQ